MVWYKTYSSLFQWVSDGCLTTSVTFVIYIMTKTRYIRWDDKVCFILIILLFSSICLKVFQTSVEYLWLSWPWWYGSCIYNYLCNQCLSPLKLWIRIPLRRCVLDTTLCDTSFVSDLRQVGDFLRVLRFPPPIKLTAMV